MFRYITFPNAWSRETGYIITRKKEKDGLEERG
jgi:hypothetical protein